MSKGHAPSVTRGLYSDISNVVIIQSAAGAPPGVASPETGRVTVASPQAGPLLNVAPIPAPLLDELPSNFRRPIDRFSTALGSPNVPFVRMCSLYLPRNFAS